jgi:hypothetical protein
MKQTLALVVGAAIIISMTYGSLNLSADNDHKVLVCHVTGNGTFHVIDIDKHALPAHQAHGDSLALTGFGKGDPCVATSTPPPPTVDSPQPPTVDSPPPPTVDSPQPPPTVVPTTVDPTTVLK